MVADAKKEFKTLGAALESIQKNGAALKNMGRGLGATNTYAESKYAEEVKQVSAGLKAASAKFSEANQKDLETKMADLESNIAKSYTDLVEGKEHKPTEWKALFQPIKDKLEEIKNTIPTNGEIKKIAETQLAELEKIQNDKLTDEAKALARSLDNQHATNGSLNASYDLAKYTYGFSEKTLFEEILRFDEKKLDAEIKGQSGALVHMVTPETEEDEFRKKVKDLREAKRRLFTSENYKDANGNKIVFEKTKDGGWWPRPPLAGISESFATAYPKYVKAYEGTFQLARISDPNVSFTFSVFINQEGHHGQPHPIQTADDIRLKVLSVFVAAQKAGAVLQLDDATRNHLNYLRDQGGRSGLDVVAGTNPVTDAVEAVFAIEKHMVEGSKKLELIDKEEKEWKQEIEKANSDIVVPADSMKAKLDAALATLPAGAGQHAAAIGKLIDDDAAFTNPAAIMAAGTLAEQRAEQLKQLTDQVNTLEGRIKDATNAADLIERQIIALTNAATAQPDAKQVQEKGHIVKLEELRDQNARNIENLKIQTEVYKGTVSAIATPVGSQQDTERRELMARIDGQTKSIDTLAERNNNNTPGANSILNKIQAYKEHQAKQFKELFKKLSLSADEKLSKWERSVLAFGRKIGLAVEPDDRQTPRIK